MCICNRYVYPLSLWKDFANVVKMTNLKTDIMILIWSSHSVKSENFSVESGEIHCCRGRSKESEVREGESETLRLLGCLAGLKGESQAFWMQMASKGWEWPSIHSQWENRILGLVATFIKLNQLSKLGWEGIHSRVPTNKCSYPVRL